ncbi:MAG: Fur family transcriptional regulator [Lachnospiraceae bacterium]|jgi:Fur family peroxide stress response transcriptional regulator
MIQKLATRLKDSGVKPSVQRIKILKYFLRNRNHPTAEKIYQDLNTEMPTLSQATVYNTLKLFKEKQLIKIVSSEDQNAHYDLVGDEHGHFYCRQCREVYDFSYDYAGSYAQLEGFDIESEEIIIKGICKKCLEKDKNRR